MTRQRPRYSVCSFNVSHTYILSPGIHYIIILKIDIEEVAPAPLLDLSRPRYDQSTFTGRAKHFIETTDPRNLLASHEKLEAAATLVKQYK